MLVDFLVAVALHKQSIASGHDVFDAEASIRAGECRVVSAIALALGDQLDESLLQGLAARILGDDPAELGLHLRRSLRAG